MRKIELAKNRTQFRLSQADMPKANEQHSQSKKCCVLKDRFSCLMAERGVEGCQLCVVLCREIRQIPVRALG